MSESEGEDSEVEDETLAGLKAEGSEPCKLVSRGCTPTARCGS